MYDLLLHHARLPDGSQACIAIQNGVISRIEPHIEAPARRHLELDGWLVSPPFVDSHFHLDSALTAGQPRHNLSGTLLEGIAIWAELKPQLDEAQIYQRARRLCEMAIAQGNLAIRSHVDISDPRLTAARALLQLRDDMRPWLDIQLIAFPQDGYLRLEGGRRQLRQALQLGLDGIGGIPHFERTQADGAASIVALCRLAADLGLPLDMHCDETDDPCSRHIETLAAETLRHGLQGRVTGSHLTSMHSMDNAYAGKLIGLMQEAGLHAIANPLINITLQGRYDTYPKRRGMTRVKELRAAGIRVGFGHDCVMDPWYRLGSHDMLEVAAMGAHVGQLTAEAELLDCYRSVTTHPAAIMGLNGYGLAEGCRADLVVLQALDPIEAIRLRPARLWVIRGGRIIAETAPRHSLLHLEHSRPLDLSRLDPPPQA